MIMQNDCAKSENLWSDLTQARCPVRQPDPSIGGKGRREGGMMWHMPGEQGKRRLAGRTRIGKPDHAPPPARRMGRT